MELLHAVVLPEGTDEDEFLAGEFVDFFSEVSTLFQLEEVQEVCSELTEPGQGFPRGIEYRWADASATTAQRVSAPAYIVHVLAWIQDMFQNAAVFPVSLDDAFPATFKETYMSELCTRLFRVFAVFYHTFLDTFEALGVDNHLHSTFKHFIFFVVHFDLVQPKEHRALKTVIPVIMADYVRAVARSDSESEPGSELKK